MSESNEEKKWDAADSQMIEIMSKYEEAVREELRLAVVEAIKSVELYMEPCSGRLALSSTYYEGEGLEWGLLKELEWEDLRLAAQDTVKGGWSDEARTIIADGLQMLANEFRVKD